jgi:Tol biopolymer transport system component
MVWRLAAIAFALLFLLAAPPALRHIREVPPPLPPPVRVAITAPAGSELGVGDDVLDAAVSPDGREIVFVATSDGVSRLWRRGLGNEGPVPLAGTEGASMPAWKSTGRAIAYFADGRLKQVALGDGSIRDLAEAPSPAGAAWLPDGSLLFVPAAQGPVRHLREGMLSDATTLREGDRGHGFPAATDAGSFTYIATRSDGVKVVRLVAGTEQDLTQTSGPARLVGGRLVHFRDGTVIAQRFDSERRELSARSTPLALNVGADTGGHGFLAVSPTLIAWAGATSRVRDLVWLDFEGRRLGTAAEPGDYWQLRLSPTDEHAAVTRLDPLLRALDVWVMKVNGAAPPEQLTLALGADTDPVWAPAGDRIVFRSVPRGDPGLFIRRVHAPEAPIEPLVTTDLDETPSDWRGGTLLFHAPGATGTAIFALDVAQGTRREVSRRGFNAFDARFSPDGRRMVYASDEPGRPDIYVEEWSDTPVEGLSRRLRISFAGGIRPQWSGDGRSILFIRDGRLMRADDQSDGTFSTPRELGDVRGIRDFAVARRSNRILAIVPRERTEDPVMHVIMNWATIGQ